MRQHDEDGPIQPGRGETEDSDDDEAEVTDRRIGDQLLHIRLHQRDQRAVDDADQRQNHDPRRVAVSLIGEQADIEAQQAVGAHLQQNARQQHRSGGGCLHVRVGQPGVKREERDLDRKGDEEAEEEPQRGVFETGHAAAANRVLNHGEIETAGLGVEPKNCRQHEHRADDGKQEILHRGVDPPSVAVHADQQRHRNQRRFPEEVEQEQIERGENADQGRFQDQQQDEEFLDPLVDRSPRNQHAQRREESRQHHQPDGNSVNAHVVMNVGSRDPDFIDLELEGVVIAVQIYRQMQRGHKRQHGDDQRKNLDVAITAGNQQNQQPAHGRDEGHQRKNDGAETFHVHRTHIHRTPIQTM